LIVLETSALVAIVTAEAGYEALFEAVMAADRVLLPPHCLLEAHMVIAGRFPPRMGDLLNAFVAGLAPDYPPFTEAHAQEARRAFDRFGKGRHPAGLNFGDCISYTVAKVEGLPLLYVGTDFGATDVVGVLGSVVKPALHDSQTVAFDTVDQTMLSVDATGPMAGQVAF
jgi:ribonuclease VapC